MSEAYLEGAEAFMEWNFCLDERKCPYAGDTQEGRDWLAGWVDAVAKEAGR